MRGFEAESDADQLRRDAGEALEARILEHARRLARLQEQLEASKGRQGSGGAPPPCPAVATAPRLAREAPRLSNWSRFKSQAVSSDGIGVGESA